MRHLRDPAGQASVELVALLPLLVGGLLVCWQLVLAGHAAWSASAAARSAARAAAVGADPLAAARRALPSSLRRGVAVRGRDAARVTVRLRVPAVVPGLHLGTLSAGAAFAPQR